MSFCSGPAEGLQILRRRRTFFLIDNVDYHDGDSNEVMGAKRPKPELAVTFEPFVPQKFALQL